jgi:hypothetical protein
MSTVQSLLDNLQFRVDTTADLYHLINLAIRRIATRLYWHKSNIIVDEFSLNLYAPVEYAADTIALVNSNPDTITDSAEQLVDEGFKSGMFIETDHASNTGAYEINTVAAGTITLVSADNLTAVTAGSEITITSLADRVSLPSDFWGLCGDGKEDYPNIDGQTDVLLPLPSRKTALEAGSASTPEYFIIKGTRMFFSPSTGSDIVIKGDYFKRPAALSALTDTVPFNELFDDAICEAVALLYEKGLSSQAENETLLDKVLFNTVDMIVPGYGRRASTGAQGGIDWASFT